jgi:hypothetical protein
MVQLSARRLSPCVVVAFALALSACEADHARRGSHGDSDAAAPAPPDASRPIIIAEDAGAPPSPPNDAGVAPPIPDAGPWNEPDASVVPPSDDAGEPPPPVDAGTEVPEDAGPPPDPCEWVDCSPKDACHAPGTCDPTTRACNYPELPDGFPCDDANACTYVSVCRAGACTPDTAAVNLADDGSECDDGDECTIASVCAAGVCVGTAHRGDGAPCEDHSDCTSFSTCEAGVCVGAGFRGDGEPCDDHNECTAASVCEAGVCAPRRWRVCAPLSPCHDAGVCNPENGRCRYPIAHEGAACDDGDACTADGTCLGGVCAFGPSANVCDVVTVRIDDATGRPLTEEVELRAVAAGAPLIDFVRTTSPTARLPVPPGTYRFEARTTSDQPIAVPFDDDVVASCTVPGCDTVEIRVGAPTDLVTLAFFGSPVIPTSETSRVYPDSFYEGRGDAPWIKRFQGVEVEWWSIDHFGTPSVRWYPPHDHLWADGRPSTFSGLVDASDNSGRDIVENLHAWGAGLQGIHVSLPDEGLFDLVSIDVRVRDDHTQGHFSTVPYYSSLDNVLLLSKTLSAAYPPPDAFVEVPLPPAPMVRYQRLTITGFEGVQGVFISANCNVSIDDVVLRRAAP